MLPPAAAPAFVSPREQGSWQDARVSGRRPRCAAPHIATERVQGAWEGEAAGNLGDRAGEWPRSPVGMNGKDLDLHVAPEQSNWADGAQSCSELVPDLLHGCWEPAHRNGKGSKDSIQGNKYMLLSHPLQPVWLQTRAMRKTKGLFDQVRTSAAAT